eukprot:s365_g19.t1
MEAARVGKHPFSDSGDLPIPMLDAIVAEVGRTRSAAMREIVHKAAELRHEEAALKEAMFEKKIKPAHVPTAALRGVAAKAREAFLMTVKASGDHDLDVGIYEATQKELEKGFLEGPIDPTFLPDGAALTHRFEAVQRGNVKPIDDYNSSLVNSGVTQPEAVSIHGIDHIAGMGAAYLRATEHKGRHAELVLKCWDLAAAYKQVPLSDGGFEMDAFLVVYNPNTQKAEVYQQRVLPFGSIASVTAFLRCSLAIWHIGCSLLKLTWTSYFDDFLPMSDRRL